MAANVSDDEAVVNCVAFFTKKEKAAKIFARKTNFAVKSRRTREAYRSLTSQMNQINYQSRVT